MICVQAAICSASETRPRPSHFSSTWDLLTGDLTVWAWAGPWESAAAASETPTIIARSVANISTSLRGELVDQDLIEGLGGLVGNPVSGARDDIHLKIRF